MNKIQGILFGGQVLIYGSIVGFYIYYSLDTGYVYLSKGLSKSEDWLDDEGKISHERALKQSTYTIYHQEHKTRTEALKTINKFISDSRVELDDAAIKDFVIKNGEHRDAGRAFVFSLIESFPIDVVLDYCRRLTEIAKREIKNPYPMVSEMDETLKNIPKG